MSLVISYEAMILLQVSVFCWSIVGCLCSGKGPSKMKKRRLRNSVQRKPTGWEWEACWNGSKETWTWKRPGSSSLACHRLIQSKSALFMIWAMLCQPHSSFDVSTHSRNSRLRHENGLCTFWHFSLEDLGFFSAECGWVQHQEICPCQIFVGQVRVEQTSFNFVHHHSMSCIHLTN